PPGPRPGAYGRGGPARPARPARPLGRGRPGRHGDLPLRGGHRGRRPRGPHPRRR
ncbi:hypothetical protein STREPTOSP366_57440, partial [Streptomyces variabilis]